MNTMQLTVMSQLNAWAGTKADPVIAAVVPAAIVTYVATAELPCGHPEPEATCEISAAVPGSIHVQLRVGQAFVQLKRMQLHTNRPPKSSLVHHCLAALNLQIHISCPLVTVTYSILSAPMTVTQGWAPGYNVRECHTSYSCKFPL